MRRNARRVLWTFEQLWAADDLVEAETLFLNATPSAGSVIADKHGKELLYFAIFNNRVGLATRLVNEFHFGDEDELALAAFNAASESSLGVLRVLVEHGVSAAGFFERNVFAQSSIERWHRVYIPLHAAAGKGHVEILKYLLDRGVRVGALNWRRFNATNRASVFGNLEALCHLLNAGGDPGLEAPAKPSLVEDSVLCERPHILAALLLSGSDVADDPEFLSVLLQRCMYGPHSRMQIAVASMLVEQGALHPTRLTWEEPHNALACAARHGSLPMLRYILSTEAGPAQLNRVVNGKQTPLSLAAARSQSANHLHDVSGSGYAIVRELLRAGATLDVHSSKCGDSPLREACYNGNTRVVEQLLRAGANPCADEGAIAPLFDAAFSGSVACIKILLAHGADPNDSRSRILPLTGAIRGDSWPAVEALLAGGARLDAASYRGMCPMPESIYFFADGEAASGSRVLWSTTFIRLARRFGCGQRIEGGCTALLIAAMGADVEQVKFLLSVGAGDVDVAFYGTTALVESIRRGNHAVPVLLVEAGADWNMKLTAIPFMGVIGGFRPLLVAVLAGHMDFVRFLVLEKGANINEVFCDEGTALWYAVHASHCTIEGEGLDAVLTSLLELGADANFADIVRGCSVIARAAKSSRYDAVVLLARNGADLTRQSFRGDTVLHHIARFQPRTFEEAEVIGVLVEHGADLAAVNFFGETCLHAAARWHADLICWKLMEFGADTDARDLLGRTPLMLGCIANETSRTQSLDSQLSTVNVFISLGARVDARSSRGLTPLHFAARDGATDICRYLLLKGANVRDVAHRSGKTALHFAVGSGNERTVSFLLTRGAYVDALDRRGRSSLYLAAHSGDPEVVEVLLNRGANVGICSKAGRSPLQAAQRRKHAHVLRAFACACPDAAVFDRGKARGFGGVRGGSEVEQSASVGVRDAVVDLCTSCWY